ncbi:hypothetical protein SERLA73DRAFT_90104 [Serpula lacrymans var. lacrymans S7.3]|uniref:Nitrogen permease regulator 3 n=2 Tax=Serpula lacrymans var. lacrymans TaxID=341189 RepID=F8PYL6_SERL3|nr:uncharacterized protein SERLADRAFT_449339 [Serpula lacrymans var. lacrymans S7.9]EGN98979.1 hypothetical protein SERLA73DRAFT_90104 [Serpula lacrymans var. lacrymans S7.3]EGO24567.1 hypothetical protein SERLADRAFT_449339 [Serpula lacrymans var. lacrymans S7.9]
MAESLLSILLVTSSAKGSSVVFRWPPCPQTSSRLARPRPPSDNLQLDNPWRAANFSDPFSSIMDRQKKDEALLNDMDDYEWKRPTTLRDRSTSFSRSAASSSGRNSPSKDAPFDHDDLDHPQETDAYHDLFGYSSEFLASMLCPQRSLCHQKFELRIDDLVFLGHPVGAESDGSWRFKSEKLKSGSRGRGSRNRDATQQDDGKSEISSIAEKGPPAQSLWLQMFHFVIVLDLPDPSSSASGNVAKYFDVIYEQIAFTVTAVLFQEQVLSNFVEAECDILVSLKDEYIDKGEPYSEFNAQALLRSSLAPAMKTLYEAIQSSTMAYITIHDLPLELQLPPYLDHLLHSEEEYDLDFVDYKEDDDESRAWGREMSFGWRLPALAPWKSLLLLDGDQGLDPYMNLRGPHVRPEERTLAQGLIKFLETASVTLSLADMASLLDWDLENQIYPTVRWLVHHRRAKVVDIVHSGLKTIFTLPPRFEASLSSLSIDFKREFPHPSIPHLPTILSNVSTATSKQSDNHFFATVVQSKELIPLYHDVVLWMLKHELLLTLHLRIRIVATSELKKIVRFAHERRLGRLSQRERQRARGRQLSQKFLESGDELSNGLSEKREMAGVAWLSLSPKTARRYSRRLPSTESGQSKGSDMSGSVFVEDEDGQMYEEEESEEENVGWGTREDNVWPSMISDPGMATPLERRWLAAMSEGKEEYIARRFEKINQYFDGKKTDDEILFRAEISRKQLREVLHHYEEYLQTFLHPS